MSGATMTMRQAKRLWEHGNDHGHGYAAYTYVPGEDTVAAAVAAAEAEGWSLVHARNGSDEIAVLVDVDGTFLGIGGDAFGRGAWAVVLSNEEGALAEWDADQSDAMCGEVQS